MVTTSGPAKGHLLVHGGGNIDGEFRTLFKKLACGPCGKIVYIPTAEGDDKLGRLGPITQCSVFGGAATSLHTRDPKVANSVSFVKPISEATGVYIDGGRQPRLADSYLHTRTHQELEDLLDRGGVIAGNSAGATIQGSFLIRGQGAPDYDNKVIIGDHQEGFGFIKNISIDQHITVRHRETDLAQALKTHPDLLGIGIDEDTAIHVQADIFTVIGSGYIFVHDGPPPYYKLRRGQEFDLRKRRVL